MEVFKIIFLGLDIRLILTIRLWHLAGDLRVGGSNPGEGKTPTGPTLGWTSTLLATFDPRLPQNAQKIKKNDFLELFIKFNDFMDPHRCHKFAQFSDSSIN